MKDTMIVNLVGASGSGKTSVAKYLEDEYGYNVIQSYTTRPKRGNQEYGHTFLKGLEWNLERSFMEYVCTERDNWMVREYFHETDVIAYFNSYDSGNEYFATHQQIKMGSVNLYIVDPEGAKQVHDYYRGTEMIVITVYIQSDEDVRARRLLDREDGITNPERFEDEPKHCPEVYSRLRPDRDIFEFIKCDFAVNGNKKLENVSDLVFQCIESILGV